uniref:Clavesin 1 n=1 Tax=Rousettus aegyptiacus TaxID=9407 RepID=A0A7J8C191_ROUAE|nr:clavesin 1 [Rousettus aegyptiacus]
MGPVSLLLKYQKLSNWKGDLAKMTHLQAGLSPETIEKARLELNENPDVLHQDIQQVRDMIITRPDIGFLRTDDAFILRFLRARKFHQADAFRLLAQYFQYRQLNLDMFKNFKADDPGIKRALIDGFPGVLENRDHYGRKILLLFAANWDQRIPSQTSSVPSCCHWKSSLKIQSSR